MLRKLAVLALAPLFACGSSNTTTTETDGASSTGDSDTAGTTGEPTYRATIRRTSFGVAHVQADDLGSALFGQAYAFAQDHACTLADQLVKVRSERAKYFGRGNGDAH